MQRYRKILQSFWRTGLAAELEYRSNFWLSVITSAGNLVGALFGLYLFYRRDFSFSGWTWWESTVVVGVFTLISGYTSSFLVPNLSRIVVQVREGTLDFVLLKPMDTQVAVSLRVLSPWGLPDMLFGVLVIAYASFQMSTSWYNLLLGLWPLLAAGILLYSLWFIIASTTIWFVKIANATEVLRGLLEAGRFPIQAYPSAYRFFFTFVVPVAFLTSVPAETLIGRGSVRGMVASSVIAALSFAGARRFWRFALRSYTSASS